MKQFFIFIKKETYHILRDRRTLIILLGMPLVLVLLFGFAITNEINNAKISILDQAQDGLSREMKTRLSASSYFTIEKELADLSEIEPHFQEGVSKMVVVFPEQLEGRLQKGLPTEIQLIADATDPNTATTLANYAQAILSRHAQETSGLTVVPMQIKANVTMLYNPRLKSVFMFVPGVMTVILMLVSAMMTSIAITREKELGTMEVLLVSPLRPFLIIVGKVIPYILLSIINTIVILTLGKFVFQMPVEGSYLLLGLEALLFVITSLALGILISTRTDSQQVAMMISLMVLMLPTILLSGFIFPIESMPWLLQLISNIIPAKWFIIIIKNIMLKGTGLELVWEETLILLGMALALIAASVRNFKIRLE
jgi:ABC-2 type transport system permease protein